MLVDVALDKIESVDCSAPDGLVKSIEQRGLLNPVLLMHDGQQYRVIAGRRRVAACRQLRWQSIPANVVDCEQGSSLKSMLMLDENLHRSANPIAEAEAMQQIMQDYGIDERELAKLLSININVIRQRLRLLSLHPQLRERCREGKISVNAAIHAVKLSEHTQAELANTDIKITNRMVQSLLQNQRAQQVELSALGDVLSNSNHEYVDLAARLSAIAMTTHNSHRAVLLEAALVLTMLASQ